MLDIALKLDPELKTATDLAFEAGTLIRRMARGTLQETLKEDSSPVTRADLEADRIIIHGLREAFPADGILTEESAHRPTSRSGRVWVVDPLDGTEAYLAGRIDYAVQIGLLDEASTPLLGVLYEPGTGRIYHAIRGLGTFMSMSLNGTMRQLRVRRRATDERLITTSSLDETVRERLLRRLQLADGGRVRSVGFKIGMLVRGEADIYYSGHPLHYWDTCAPYVILEAAGGVMTELDGTPVHFDLEKPDFLHGGALVASDGSRHADLCRQFVEVLG
jgi:3'(2'),5'-bisphosphate nucleotidase